MTEKRPRDATRQPARWPSGLIYVATGVLALAGLILATVAFIGVGPLGFLLFPPIALGLLAALLVAVALLAGARKRHASRRSWRALAASLGLVVVGFLLIPAVALAKQQLAKREAAQVIDDIEARAAYCVRREAREVRAAIMVSATGLRSYYRRAVEVCITEGDRFREWPDGPQATCWSGRCTVDFSYVDVYPVLDSRLIDLEPFMERALEEAGMTEVADNNAAGVTTYKSPKRAASSVIAMLRLEATVVHLIRRPLPADTDFDVELTHFYLVVFDLAKATPLFGEAGEHELFVYVARPRPDLPWHVAEYGTAP